MNNYVNVYPERLPFSLPAESAMFYNNKHDPGPDLGNDIILWMRSLRSALVAGELKTPDDLQKPITNCLGAVALFNSAIDESNDPGYMLLLRSSWQHPDNQTSIHVVSSVFSRYLGSRLYADPTPTAGYLYGTADKIDMLQGDKYVSTDKIIKVNNYFKLLSNDEVSALFEFYYAKALVQSHPEEAYRRLKLVLEKLDESPAYQAKACMLLDNLEQDSIQNNYWLNNRAQLSGIPEFVKHGSNGILVAPSDVSGLGDAIHGLLGNKSLQQELGRQARLDILKYWSWESRAILLEKEYNTIVEEGGE